MKWTQVTLLLVAALLTACKPSEESQLKAIIGAVLIDGNGGAPLSDSVLITAGSRIRLVGPRSTTPIPAGSEKVDGRGRFLVPELIDLGSAKLRAIATLAEARQAVAAGEKALAGMIADAETLDAVWLAELRALRVVFAPGLSSLAGEQLDRARRNTGQMAKSGVAIGAASSGDLHRELEMLAGAGIGTMEVIVAATRSAALARGESDRLGTLEPGKEANLLLLSANPLEDTRNLTRVERAMHRGEWVK
jgi:imidazolonepropionase-like amidohydrolase